MGRLWWRNTCFGIAALFSLVYVTSSSTKTLQRFFRRCLPLVMEPYRVLTLKWDNRVTKGQRKLSPAHDALHQMSQRDKTEPRNTSSIMDHFLHLSGTAFLHHFFTGGMRQELIYACLSTRCNAVKSWPCSKLLSAINIYNGNKY